MAMSKETRDLNEILGYCKKFLTFDLRNQPISCIMGGASHGSSRPVRTCPFDLITLNHFAHIFLFSFLSGCLFCCNGQ